MLHGHDKKKDIIRADLAPLEKTKPLSKEESEAIDKGIAERIKEARRNVKR